MSTAAIPTVTFTVTKFHKIGGNNSYCKYGMSLENGGNLVTLSGDTLTVSGSTPLVFMSTGNYLLAGLCFKQVAGGMTDPIGMSAFPTSTLTLTSDGADPPTFTSTITLVDLDNTSDSYEFALLVIDVGGKALGVIDPPIINKPPQ